MKVRQHIISSLPLGTVCFISSGNLFLSVITMIASIMVDFDHVVDYIITRGRISSLREMIKTYEDFGVHKNYLLLHSWEVIFPLSIYLLFYPCTLLNYLFVGYVFHVILDQIYNVWFLGEDNVKIPYYSFIFRMWNNFDVKPLRISCEKSR